MSRQSIIAKVLVGGTVVTGQTGHPVLPDHDVWLSGDTISAITPSGEHDVPEQCEVIDARHAIVMPGLIDSHRHLWQTTLRGMCSDMIAPEYRHQLREALVPFFRPEDVYAATLAGALELIDCGITTVLDWVHILNSPQHADASIAALRTSGMRAIFAHSAPNDMEASLWWSNSERKHPADVRRVREELSDKDALVTMAFGARAPHLVQREVRNHDWHLARELDLRIVTDGGIGGGLWAGRTYPIRLLQQDGLLWPGTVYVHCNNLAPDEYALIRESGGYISASPCAEMYVGFGMPATLDALAHGIRPALSTDSVTFVAGDMFGTMRSTLTSLRGMLGYKATAQEEGVGPWEITSADIFEMATARGAEALGLADRVGTLEVGKAADIVILNTRSVRLSPLNNPIATIALLATPADVETVLVAGNVVKREGKLVQFDQGRVVDDLVRSRDWLITKGGAELGPAVQKGLASCGLDQLIVPSRPPKHEGAGDV
ncbi:amidohydrolase family protein [Phyllobacterium chamaecytisi]|uniref:amidohydrolase family protein n=1 Tax=Phyllobacterium chamaecytisi TaxID=2876082 RepID=UPI001CCFEE93|nr:amidohydrolase family protein [Phyllobacterium sp. KW56]MBZ9603232.1 amidohydrolase family protein [Phyllobacterium sp. KW56]